MHSRLRERGSYLVGPLARYALSSDRLSAVVLHPRPAALAVEVAPRAGTGFGWIEAPRGMPWHRYEIDEEGTILRAQIVPPTSQNQRTVEEDLHAVVRRNLELADEPLRLRCEQAIRNYDPRISCATHFLKLEVDRA